MAEGHHSTSQIRIHRSNVLEGFTTCQPKTIWVRAVHLFHCCNHWQNSDKAIIVHRSIITCKGYLLYLTARVCLTHEYSCRSVEATIPGLRYVWTVGMGVRVQGQRSSNIRSDRNVVPSIQSSASPLQANGVDGRPRKASSEKQLWPPQYCMVDQNIQVKARYCWKIEPSTPIKLTDSQSSHDPSCLHDELMHSISAYSASE